LVGSKELLFLNEELVVFFTFFVVLSALLEGYARFVDSFLRNKQAMVETFLVTAVDSRLTEVQTYLLLREQWVSFVSELQLLFDFLEFEFQLIDFQGLSSASTDLEYEGYAFDLYFHQFELFNRYSERVLEEKEKNTGFLSITEVFDPFLREPKKKKEKVTFFSAITAGFKSIVMSLLKKNGI